MWPAINFPSLPWKPVKVWRSENIYLVKMWNCEPVKNINLCENVKVWTCEKYNPVWKCEGVNLVKNINLCENVKVWTCEKYKPVRKMWRCEEYKFLWSKLNQPYFFVPFCEVTLYLLLNVTEILMYSKFQFIHSIKFKFYYEKNVFCYALFENIF